MNSQPAAEPIRIFLAEDNVADVVLIREAFKGLKCAHNLLIVQDGEAAPKYFGAFGKARSAARGRGGSAGIGGRPEPHSHVSAR